MIINNLPGDTNTLDFELNFTPAECRLPLNIIDPPTSCNLSESIIRNMNTTSENQSYTIESVMGSTVIFEYSLNFGPRETIEIPLTKIDTEYVFEY